MGLFNILNTEIVCPRCGSESETEVELHFGLKNQTSYKLGDRVLWKTGKAVQNGGRPKDGNADAEGYAECPVCDRDFFLKITVRNDIIQATEPDYEKKGYIPDTIHSDTKNTGRKAFLIPFDELLAGRLTEIAESKQIPPETLIELWVKEKISESYQQI